MMTLSDISTTLETYEIGTCPNCGLPLLAGKIYGMEVKLECKCQTEAREQEEALKIEQKKKIRISENRCKSGLPKAYINTTFDSFKKRQGTETALRNSQKYVAQIGGMSKGLLLIGNTGSGKTHLAAAIANAVLDAGYTVKFIRASDIPYEIQRTYGDSDKSESEVIEPLRKCKLLIVDDLGADKMTDFDRAVIHGILDYRIINFKPTVVTTNLTEPQMTSLLDSRTVDRLLGKDYYQYRLTAPSYRRKKDNPQN